MKFRFPGKAAPARTEQMSETIEKPTATSAAQPRESTSEMPQPKAKRRFPEVLSGVLLNNLWLKLLSLLLAILLWNYVISTNTSITRPKTLYGITGYVSGQVALTDYGLALLEDPETALSNISVTVEAPQANYARVSSDNVQVTLDLSNIRAAGTQEVRLRASSAYGRVTSIVPASVTLTFEQLDSRSVPVNYQIIGDEGGNMWYNVTRVNPSAITVSGAASKVRNIVSANVLVDVTELDSASTKALPYTLVDDAGGEIAIGMLNRSTSSISISLDAYPSREVPVTTDLNAVLSGEPAEGYEVQGVTVQPDTIVIAGEQDLLDGIAELMLEPVSVEGATQSFSARASLSMLSDIRYASSEQVYVNVTIGPKNVTGQVDNIQVLYAGLPEGWTAEYDGLSVTATGAPADLEALQRSGVVLTVDVEGLEPGTHAVEPRIAAEDYPNITLQAAPLNVTIHQNESAQP